MTKKHQSSPSLFSSSLCNARHQTQVDPSGAIDPSVKGKSCPQSFLLGSQVMLSSASVCYFYSVFVWHATSRLSTVTNNQQTAVLWSIWIGCFSKILQLREAPCARVNIYCQLCCQMQQIWQHFFSLYFAFQMIIIPDKRGTFSSHPDILLVFSQLNLMWECS